ncbi:hypothetical protein I546_2983 [Mycobacterium kansasii 732]|nr:hypothetical protein I546_2983 [Mycobacterium kansasii 732]
MTSRYSPGKTRDRCRFIRDENGCSRRENDAIKELMGG